jgi:hypothetical protein
MKSKTPKVAMKWLPEPEKQDYPASMSYLSLIFEAKVAAQFVKKLKKAPVMTFHSKDIFRASALSLLGAENYHVQKDRKKIIAGAKLSPILLVRESALGRVIIADGYHRMCAVYTFDEDAMIPCKIV